MSSIYRKGQALGWGGFATVFKGWDELLDRPVAIKELVPPFAGSDPFRRSYLGQALRMVDVAHAHVLATYTVEPNRTPPAFTRELGDETLGHQLIEGPVAPEAILRILRHALSGLDALHEREILHRSIKPENLFVCGSVYKIGDFGIPSLAGGPTFPPRHFKYTAPEALSEESSVGPPSDLYSLGLVIYELLLGSVRFETMVEETLPRSRRPEEGEDEEEKSRDLLWIPFHSSPSALPALHEVEPSIPVALSLVVRKMIAKDPSERYSSCREVLAALGAAGLVEAAGGSQSIVVPSLARQVPPSRRSPSSTLLGGGVVAALALAGLALVIGVRGRDEAPAGNSFSETEAPSSPSLPDLGGEASLPASVTDLADRVLALRGGGGLALDLEPERSGSRLPLGAPLRFEVSSDRPAYLALFVLSSTGSVFSLYPGSDGRELRIEAGRRLVLPRPEDVAMGFDLTASEPVGRDYVVLLSSQNPLPPVPAGDVLPWVIEYPFSEGRPESPAVRWLDWLTRLRRDPDTRLSVLAIEVVRGE